MLFFLYCDFVTVVTVVGMYMTINLRETLAVFVID